MAPTPELANAAEAQVAMAHAHADNATYALVTFYASVSLLGISVVFLIGYFAVKGFTADTGGRKRVRAAEKTRAGAVAGVRRNGSLMTLQGAVEALTQRGRQSSPAERRGPGEVRSGARQAISTSASDAQAAAECEAWAAAYLRHVRNMEDYAAGLPLVVHTRAPTPTPPPLYSTVCRASSGTIGIARPRPHRPQPLPSADSEADIADILGLYSAGSDADADVDVDSANSSLSSVSVQTPDGSLSEGLFPGAIPAIVVDACEDAVPPPYEEDIADQAPFGGSGSLYLKVPSPRKVKFKLDAPVLAAPGSRRKAKAGRSPSIIARFANREGFFRMSRAKQQPRSTTATMGCIAEQ